MRRVWTTIKIVLFLFVFGLLHYVLPQHDVARVDGTDLVPVDFSVWNRPFFAQADSGNVEKDQRFVRLIYSEKKKTWLLGFVPRSSNETMVYRNEDTGWIWPPYFKFDSSNVQAKAEANVSPKDGSEEKWVVITHYGWRNYYLTIYPNIIGIRPVAGPDVTVIPWFNIFFFAFVLLAYGMIRAMWRQFRERTIDPAWDDVHESVTQQKGRISRWLDSWRSKK